MKILKLCCFTLIFNFVVSYQPVLAQNKDSLNNKKIITDTAVVIGGVVVDTTSKNNPDEIAKQMATNLMYRINLTMEQTEKVASILKDYQGEIADAQTKIKNDKNDEVGGRPSKNMLSDIDNNANQKIEDVLDESQRDSYSFIKNDWWKQVKQKIYNKNESPDLEK